MEGSWRPAPLELEFRLGEFRVLTVNLKGMTLLGQVGAGGEAGAGDGPLPPEGLFASDAQAAIVRSLPIGQPLPRLSLRGRFIRYVPAQYRRYFVDLRQGTFEQYLLGFSSKSRNTLKRKIRKCGDLVCREFRTRAEIEEFLALVRPLSDRTYQERLLGRGLPSDQAFLDEVFALADAGNARGYLLLVGGRPAAFLLCPIYDGRVLYEWVGYEPDLAALSPGTVLQYFVLEKLFAEGRFQLFDFTEGEGGHKEFWARSHAQCADVYYFPTNLKNAALVGCHSALHTVSRTAVRTLDRLGWKDKLKRALRGWRRPESEAKPEEAE
jgi:CelD/BcsL family acetyltransferase involved in cellulose biosynthesis